VVAIPVVECLREALHNEVVVVVAEWSLCIDGYLVHDAQILSEAGQRGEDLGGVEEAGTELEPVADSLTDGAVDVPQRGRVVEIELVAEDQNVARERAAADRAGSGTAPIALRVVQRLDGEHAVQRYPVSDASMLERLLIRQKIS